MAILENLFSSLPWLIAAGVLFLLAVVVVWQVVRRYQVAAPDEALIITSLKRGGKAVMNPETGKVTDELAGQRVVVGAGTFVKPLVERWNRISLSSRPVRLEIRGVVSQSNIPLNIDGIAIVKIGGSENHIRAAAQRFLGQQDAIEEFATEVLNGSLRAIIGTLTVEQVIRDRAALAKLVQEEAETSLSNQGLVIDTLQIQQVSDENNYIHNLSRPEAASIARDARIAEAEAEQETQERTAATEQKIAEANKALAIKKASIQAEQDAAEAEAEAAGPLAAAAREQEVLQAQEAVAVRRAELTARELETSVNKPADAERYRVETEAAGKRQAEILASEAEKAATIARAQAAAESIKVQAEAELAQRTARAEALRLEGEAEAAAITAKGEAEAEALRKKAEAYKQFNEAAVTQMMVDVLPKVASEIAKPLTSINGMTVISSDGASKVTQMGTDILTQTMGVMKELTGVDLKDVLNPTMDEAGKNKPLENSVVTKARAASVANTDPERTI